jgi:hypothetical protein
MSAISRCLMRRVEACLNRLDSNYTEENARSEISESDGSALVGESSSEIVETEEGALMPSLSGLDLDVFQAVTDLASVSTLSKLCGVSNVLRDLVRIRMRTLTQFLDDMDTACMRRPDLEGGSTRRHGSLSACSAKGKSIFAELHKQSSDPYFVGLATSWRITIGCWDVCVYMDAQDYICVTAVKLAAGSFTPENRNPSDMHAKFCVLHFPRGAITSYTELMHVLLPYNFNVVNGGSVSGHVFEIRPYDLAFFQNGAVDARYIDDLDVRNRPPEVLKMHKWLRSPHLLRTNEKSFRQQMKIYRWKWIPESSAYLVTFRYFSEIPEHVKLVYAYIKCMEHAPEIDFVWIFTTHYVPVEYVRTSPDQPPVPGIAIKDVWKTILEPSIMKARTSITTRYNVGHYHNLVYLLFDYNWGMRETHDVEENRLERSFNEDGTLDPAPTGYDEDGWPVLT